MTTDTITTLRKRQAALLGLARHGPPDGRRAYRTRRANLEASIDPGGRLAAAERAQRADYAERAHMTELALRRAQKRRGAELARQAALIAQHEREQAQEPTPLYGCPGCYRQRGEAFPQGTSGKMCAEHIAVLAEALGLLGITL